MAIFLSYLLSNLPNSLPIQVCWFLPLCLKTKIKKFHKSKIKTNKQKNSYTKNTKQIELVSLSMHKNVSFPFGYGWTRWQEGPIPMLNCLLVSYRLGNEE